MSPTRAPGSSSRASSRTLRGILSVHGMPKPRKTSGNASKAFSVGPMSLEEALLSVQRGSVTAAAGCGKTHLIAAALRRHQGRLPILVLTHTNAGVSALRLRLNNTGVPVSAYRVATIDGFA